MARGNKNELKEFLDAIPDAKLKNFVSSEKTIVNDKKHGFRLDHQGVNDDGTAKDRLFIQPIGGKSKASRMPTSTVLAQIHVTDPGNPLEIREALFKSSRDGARLKKLA